LLISHQQLCHQVCRGGHRSRGNHAGDPSRFYTHTLWLRALPSAGSREGRQGPRGGGSWRWEGNLLVCQILSPFVWWVALLISHQQLCLQVCGEGLLTEESCRGPQPVENAHPVGKGSPQCGHLGRSSGAARRWVLTTKKKMSMERGNLLVCQVLPPLSPVFLKVGSRFRSAGVFGLVSRGSFGSSGARGCHAGDPRAAAVFPRLTPALEFVFLGAVCGADVKGSNVDRPRSGGFQDQARVGLFVLPCGVLWASGACGSALGYHGRPLFFPWSVPETRFSVELGLRPCSLRMRLEDLAGGSCLSLLWWAAGSVQSPASLPHIHQVEGVYQVSFPCQERYSPVTRPVTLVDDGDGSGSGGSKTVSFGRCSSGSGAVWVFCLVSGGLLGVFWTPFGRRVFLWGALGLPLAPPWGLGAAGPCGGPRAVSVLSLSCPDPGFHLVPLILGRVQISFGFHLPGVSFRRRPVGPSASPR
jgi:hypothetical protein